LEAQERQKIVLISQSLSLSLSLSLTLTPLIKIVGGGEERNEIARKNNIYSHTYKIYLNIPLLSSSFQLAHLISSLFQPPASRLSSSSSSSPSSSPLSLSLSRSRCTYVCINQISSFSVLIIGRSSSFSSLILLFLYHLLLLSDKKHHHRFLCA
jgi:hypothetical protein